MRSALKEHDPRVAGASSSLWDSLASSSPVSVSIPARDSSSSRQTTCGWTARITCSRQQTVQNAVQPQDAGAMKRVGKQASIGDKVDLLRAVDEGILTQTSIALKLKQTTFEARHNNKTSQKTSKNSVLTDS